MGRNPSALGVGGVLSADIAVPEHERELHFYARVLTTGSVPLWRDDLMNNAGTPIIGLAARTPEHEALPLQWMPHIQVADVGASAARALALGGSELMHGKDKQGRSQWAVLTDPSGAAFGLVPVEDAASGVAATPSDAGRIAWLTLTASTPSRSAAFYEQVVGWSQGAVDPEGRMEMWRPDGGASASILPASGDGALVPPVWILSLPVDDLGESLRRVREGGGLILRGSADAGQAVVRDPVGVHFGLQANG